MSIDPVERRLEQSFEAERWTRFIQDCQDIEQLRETALALVQQLVALMNGELRIADAAAGGADLQLWFRASGLPPAP